MGCEEYVHRRCMNEGSWVGSGVWIVRVRNWVGIVVISILNGKG